MIRRKSIPGSAITPTLLATSSPKDLVMARPGMSSCFNQTLRGPIGFLSGSLKESILPPLLMIRSASSGWLGFWSLLTACAKIPPSRSFLTTMPLESPTLQQNNFYPRVINDTQVDPENLTSILQLKSSSLASRNALLNAMHNSSVFNGSFLCCCLS